MRIICRVIGHKRPVRRWQAHWSPPDADVRILFLCDRCDRLYAVKP